MKRLITNFIMVVALVASFAANDAKAGVFVGVNVVSGGGHSNYGGYPSYGYPSQLPAYGYGGGYGYRPSCGYYGGGCGGGYGYGYGGGYGMPGYGYGGWGMYARGYWGRPYRRCCARPRGFTSVSVSVGVGRFF